MNALDKFVNLGFSVSTPDKKIIDCRESIRLLLAERDALAHRLNDVSIACKQSNEMLKKTVAERDALAAQVSAFKKVREDWQGLAINDAKTFIAFIETSDKTPAQCLAEIRAEAVEKFSSDMASRIEVPDASPAKIEYYKASIRHVLQFASSYAAKLRQGGAE